MKTINTLLFLSILSAGSCALASEMSRASEMSLQPIPADDQTILEEAIAAQILALKAVGESEDNHDICVQSFLSNDGLIKYHRNRKKDDLTEREKAALAEYDKYIEYAEKVEASMKIVAKIDTTPTPKPSQKQISVEPTPMDTSTDSMTVIEQLLAQKASLQKEMASASEGDRKMYLDAIKDIEASIEYTHTRKRLGKENELAQAEHSQQLESAAATLRSNPIALLHFTSSMSPQEKIIRSVVAKAYVEVLAKKIGATNFRALAIQKTIKKDNIDPKKTKSIIREIRRLN